MLSFLSCRVLQFGTQKWNPPSQSSFLEVRHEGQHLKTSPDAQVFCTSARELALHGTSPRCCQINPNQPYKVFPFRSSDEIDQSKPTKFTQTIALQALHPPSQFNQLSHFNKASSSADPVEKAIQAFSECHSNVMAKTSCINVQESSSISAYV